ncbi:hypothetical protein ACFDAU_10895 [Sulfuriferula sp. GW1]|uniref:hypothetical protein n=1 Tax=Sulfuriferula sp. GW1 TaxID=3345111 RepID=UPI0039AF76D4
MIAISVAMLSTPPTIMVIVTSLMTTIIPMIPASPIAIIMASVRHNIATTQTNHH